MSYNHLEWKTPRHTNFPYSMHRPAPPPPPSLTPFYFRCIFRCAGFLTWYPICSDFEDVSRQNQKSAKSVKIRKFQNSYKNLEKYGSFSEWFYGKIRNVGNPGRYLPGRSHCSFLKISEALFFPQGGLFLKYGPPCIIFELIITSLYGIGILSIRS